ncbi:MAG: hypothetical protein COA88_02535 [Kordia sp.]|nr:MAG: hypothetical protein COA88_02535 [Kordia sp.]
MENATNYTLTAENKALIDTYNVIGTLGNVGMPGAPIMHFNLAVVPSENTVSGSVKIIQAIAPPYGQISIQNVKGQIRATGYGDVEQIVALEGNYTIGASDVLYSFKASMNLKMNWEGTGTFTYGDQTVENVHVDVEKKGDVVPKKENKTLTTNSVFELNVRSQNDAGTADGDKLFCKITNISNGSLRSGSFPIKEEVLLTIPPVQTKSNPIPPVWFLIPNDNILDTEYTIEISCPTDTSYPTKNITVKASDVEKWGAVPYNKRDNQIYQKGDYGIFGFAQEGPKGLIYTVTAGVLNPKLQG